MNPFVRFLLSQSCCNQESILGWPAYPLPGLDKRSYHGWLSMVTLSEAPSSVAPNPKSTTEYGFPFPRED